MKPIRKLKKCRVCKLSFMPCRTMQITCSLPCALKHGEAAVESKNKKERKEQKLKLKTKSKWLQEAQAVFNRFIRLRDANENCISCGRNHPGQYHAGHYRSVGAAPELRFNEDNCHKQCSPCNNHLSGNSIDYRLNLIEKIGQDRVDKLETKRELPHLTIDDIKQIKVNYQAKVKAMML